MTVNLILAPFALGAEEDADAGVIGNYEPEQRVITIVSAPVSVMDTEAVKDTEMTDGAEVTDDTEAAGDSGSENQGAVGSLNLDVDAKSAVLLDAGSGTFLYEQNSHEELPPASVTKIMTMLLAMEAIDRGQISMDDMVTISERAAGMGGSQMYMETGEQQTVETLLKGMAIASANDACVAMAEYIGGTEEIFVEMMNKRAEELGMDNTNFVNTNGLPVANHYSCAYDIGLMSKELLKYDEPKEWFSIWMTDVNVGLPGKETTLGLTNTNKLIKQYTGANGIKTGFTQEAMYCLSGSATRDDLTLIAVVLGCETSPGRFSETSRLMDYGFATYDSVILAEKGSSYGTVVVDKGTPYEIEAVAPEEISILVKKGEKDLITSETVLRDKVKAPVEAGAQIGELVIYKDGQEIERKPLTAAASAGKSGMMDLYIRMIKTLT